MIYTRQKFDLFKIKDQLQYVLELAGQEVKLEISVCHQYDDAENVQWEQTSRNVPALLGEQQREEACCFDTKENLRTRIMGGYREFCIRYQGEALSCTFVLIHIPLEQYPEESRRAEKPWLAYRESVQDTFLDRLVAAFLRAYDEKEEVSADTLVRSVGEKYVVTMLSPKKEGRNLNLPQHLNVLSSLRYEKQENAGTMVVVSAAKQLQLDMVLAEPVPIRQYKKARKLFEIASEEVLLVGSCREIYGFTRKRSLDISKELKFMLVQIYGPLHWEVLEYSTREDVTRSLIYCSNGAYRIRRNEDPLEEFRSKMRQIYPQAPVERLVPIVSAAMQQKHGTTIVFTAQAEREANRLCKSCFQIQPADISQIAHHITAIDGAVLCSPEGICYAIGIILDGMSSESEDISRGARHNSAKRYKVSHRDCVICVISEDGGMTVE